jgi:hypothetical protein
MALGEGAVFYERGTPALDVDSEGVDVKLWCGKL